MFHVGNSVSLAAEEPQEDALELVTEDAVDDEVDGGVECDQEVGDVVELHDGDAQHLVTERMLPGHTKSSGHIMSADPTSRMLTTSARMLQMKKTRTTTISIVARPTSFCCSLKLQTNPFYDPVMVELCEQVLKNGCSYLLLCLKGKFYSFMVL